MITADLIIYKEQLVIDCGKVLFWPKKSMLLISDVHLGKVAHFRKHGMPIPAQAGQRNFQNLELLIKKYLPRRVVFLGDLFHSDLNSEWLTFKALLKDFSAVRFELVIGNHDIFNERHYEGMTLHNPYLEEPPFLFSHHPLDDLPEEWYNMCGHIHPAIRLKGKGRQNLNMPCFYFGKQQAILPAFGEFTGTAKIFPKKGDLVWGILNEELIQFPTD